MNRTTITEAMAEISTIDKRVVKKTEFIQANLLRAEAMRDPFEKEGSSQRAQVAQERQALQDLLDRKVRIRMAIAKANALTKVTVQGMSKTVAEWLVWKREVAPMYQGHLRTMSSFIQGNRQNAQNRGFQVVTTADLATKAQDLIVNLDEKALMEESERVETILGTLDGQLSLVNATTFVEFE